MEFLSNTEEKKQILQFVFYCKKYLNNVNVKNHENYVFSLLLETIPRGTLDKRTHH
jgi:hypothetical protein